VSGDSDTFIYGTKKDIAQYDLSTSCITSTAKFVYTYEPSLVIDIEFLKFDDTGNTAFIKYSNNTISEFELASIYDLSNTTFESLFNMDSEDVAMTGFDFNSDGTKMYSLGSNTVFQYDLSVGFDLSTADYSNNYFDVSSEASTPLSVDVINDNRIMVKDTGGTFYQYDLTETSNVASALYNDITLSHSDFDYGTFRNNGRDFYALLSNTAIWQYDVPAENAYNLEYLQAVIKELVFCGRHSNLR